MCKKLPASKKCQPEEGPVQRYEADFLLKFRNVAPSEKVSDHFVARHPCLRIYNGCKYGEKCHFRELRIDTCWACLHGEDHDECEGPKPPVHPCMRIWGTCRYGAGCRYKTVPRVWCLLCLRGSEHTTCSGVKPKHIPNTLRDYVEGPGRVTNPSEEYEARRREAGKPPSSAFRPMPITVMTHQFYPTIDSPQISVWSPVAPLHIFTSGPAMLPSPTVSPPTSAPPSPNAKPFVSPFKMATTPEATALKSVKGALNKLTPEKFEPLLCQIQDAIGPFLDLEDTAALNASEPQKPTVLHDAASLIFEKAITEPHMSELYAQLICQLAYCLGEYHEGAAKSLRRYIIRSCQKQFMNHPVLEEDDEEGKKHYKDRSLGNIVFVGELYLVELISGQTLNSIISQLLKRHSDVPYSDQIELLCKLLEVAGGAIEANEPECSAQLFQQLHALLHAPTSIIDSRVRFAVQDILELWGNQWVARREKEGPQTLANLEDSIQRKKTGGQSPRVNNSNPVNWAA